MVRNLGNAILGVMLLGVGVASGAAISAEDRPKELDAALQQVKRDMLSLNDKLQQLFAKDEQQLESISVYLSAEPDLLFRLEKVILSLDDDKVSELRFRDSHRRALKMGGVAKVYQGTLFQGSHRLEVEFLGKGEDGKLVEYRERWSLEQSPGRDGRVELHLDNARFRRTPAVDMRVVD